MSTGFRSDREKIADRLHSAAIHLLRRVRTTDTRAGLSPARLSVLSVLAFGGDCSLSELAAAEQVRPPTMTRLVQALESEALVRRQPSPDDGRSQQVSATAKGKRKLHQARARRVKAVSELIAPLTDQQLAQLAETVNVLEQLLGN